MVSEYHGFALVDETTLPYAVDKEQIDAALERPADFAYYGDYDLFGTWAITFSTHRDDDTMGRANWDCIIGIFNTTFGPAGETWEVMHASHWGYGWVDQLIVPVIALAGQDDYGDAIYRVTEEFATALDIRKALEEYPVLDESAYSELEHDELISHIKFANVGFEFQYDTDWYETKDELPDDYAEQIVRWLFEHTDVIRVDDCSDDDIQAAYVGLGFADKMDDDDEED